MSKVQFYVMPCCFIYHLSKNTGAICLPSRIFYSCIGYTTLLGSLLFYEVYEDVSHNIETICIN